MYWFPVSLCIRDGNRSDQTTDTLVATWKQVYQHWITRKNVLHLYHPGHVSPWSQSQAWSGVKYETRCLPRRFPCGQFHINACIGTHGFHSATAAVYGHQLLTSMVKYIVYIFLNYHQRTIGTTYHDILDKLGWLKSKNRISTILIHLYLCFYFACSLCETSFIDLQAAK